MSGAASPPAPPAQPDHSAQHIRDIKLAIEFKYMMKHAPGGVFLMPTLDNNRELHGVIFLRRGLYRNGIFRFKVVLSKEYNSWNSHPQITFTPPIFNPLIHPETGVLNLKLEEPLQEWNPEKHFLLTAMTFLKGIFYMKDFEKYPRVPNEEARSLLVHDKEVYLKKIVKCVQDSLGRVYEPPEPGCLIVFTEPKPAHYNLRVDILGIGESETTTSLSDQTNKLSFYDASNEAEDADDRDTDSQIDKDAKLAATSAVSEEVV